MGSNEEYLDKLLQSVTTEEKSAVQEKQYSDNMTDEELLASLIEMYSEELAEYKTEEIIHKEENQTDSDMVPEHYTEDNIADVMMPEPIVQENNLSEDEMLPDSMLDAGLMETINEEPVTDAGANSDVVSIDTVGGENDFLSQEDIEKLLSGLTESSTELQAEDNIQPENNSDDLHNEDNTEDALLKEMGIDNMSAEQIEEMLNAAAAGEVEENITNPELEASVEADLDALFNSMSFADGFDTEQNSSQDLSDLLGEMSGGNELLQEFMNVDTDEDKVSDVQDKSLNEEADDILASLLGTAVETNGENTMDSPSMDTEKSTKTKKEKKEKKEKTPKVKKEKTPKETKLPKEDGKSFWSKLTSALFEEDESLDDKKPIKISGDDSQINLVDLDENEGILAELMNEDMLSRGKAKKKKEKPGKKDKNKKTDKKEASEEGDGGEEVLDPKAQAKEEKKKAKAEAATAKKKAKAEKAEADNAFLKAQPSISTKRAMVAFIFALSVMAIILVIYTFVPDAIEKKNARKAYYDKNYYEAYELLMGKELNDSDAILLNKVTCILQFQRKLDSYNNYIRMDNDLEAVNALIEAVKLYEENYTYSTALSIDDEVNVIYDQIIIILNGKYNITEDMAKEVLASVSDAEYTIKLQSLLNGETFDSEGESKKPMEDVLPEEEDFLEGQ